MANEVNKTLKDKYRKKIIKIYFITYADIEFLLTKTDIGHNNRKKLSATKISKHIFSGY